MYDSLGGQIVLELFRMLRTYEPGNMQSDIFRCLLVSEVQNGLQMITKQLNLVIFFQLLVQLDKKTQSILENYSSHHFGNATNALHKISISSHRNSKHDSSDHAILSEPSKIQYLWSWVEVSPVQNNLLWVKAFKSFLWFHVWSKPNSNVLFSAGTFLRFSFKTEVNSCNIVSLLSRTLHSSFNRHG